MSLRELLLAAARCGEDEIRVLDEHAIPWNVTAVCMELIETPDFVLSDVVSRADVVRATVTVPLHTYVNERTREVYRTLDVGAVRDVLLAADRVQERCRQRCDRS